MSTSDLTPSEDDLTKVVDLTGAKAAAAAGLPDPGELARMATEFFGTLPSESVLETAQIPNLPALPGTPSIPAMQGVPAMQDISLPPAFAFLNDVRAIEALPGWGATPSESQLRSAADATPAMPGVQSTGMPDIGQAPTQPATAPPGWGATPSESQLRSATAVTPAMPGVQSMPGATDPRGLSGAPGMPTQAAAPAVPGVQSIPWMGGSSVPPQFAFLSDVRQIEDIARASTQPATALSGWGTTPSESQLRSVAAVAPAVPGMQSIPWMGDVASIPGMPSMPTAVPTDAEMWNAVTPQLPGVSMPHLDSMLEPASFGFVDVLRPLEAAGAPAVAHAIPSELGGLSPSDVLSIPFDVQAIRRDFPILQESFNGKPLVWLDNAATTQKPQAVIDRLSHFYAHENSNVHRAAHQLAARATDAYEAARETVRRFLNASSTREIVFVRGTTEGINLIAQSWGRRNVGKDDEIVITWLEHHANIVPWQMLCREKGAKLRVAPVDDSGQVLLDEYERLLGPRTKLVSFSHVSNALGTVSPVEEMVAMAHRHGARVVIDGAQSVAHTHVDVQQYDCDFFVFSGHKIFAPTGVGVVYGKADVLEHMPPWQGGGNMIKDVTFEKTIYNDPPVKFEAGTGTIADAVGLGAALDYVSRLGLANIAAYEHELLDYGTEVLRRIPGLRLIGTAREKASILSFVLDGYRTEDVGAALAREGIAVRAGHHCAQPIHRRFGIESSVRPSLAFYNTCEEIDALAAALWNLKSGWNTSIR
jgi:cysteine desulfurase/selenocysteine lyase